MHPGTFWSIAYAQRPSGFLHGNLKIVIPNGVQGRSRDSSPTGFATNLPSWETIADARLRMARSHSPTDSIRCPSAGSSVKGWHPACMAAALAPLQDVAISGPIKDDLIKISLVTVAAARKCKVSAGRHLVVKLEVGTKTWLACFFSCRKRAESPRWLWVHWVVAGECQIKPSRSSLFPEHVCLSAECCNEM